MTSNFPTIRRQVLRACTAFGLVAMLLTQVGAAYQCETPYVTEVFLRDMDQRIELVQNLLRDSQCDDKSKVTLFGMDFYPDPSTVDDPGKLTGQVYDTGMRYLAKATAVSGNEALGVKEFFLSFLAAQDSYQLNLDVKEAQRRLETLRGLMSMTQQGCAQEIIVETGDVQTKLPEYTSAWYFTYRQMYFWLMISDKSSIPAEYQKIPDVLGESDIILNTLQSLYVRLGVARQDPQGAKWYTSDQKCTYGGGHVAPGESLPQNFFSCNPFYTKEYASDLLAACHSPELNIDGLSLEMDRLQEALNNVGPSFEDIGTAASELGSTTQSRLADLQKVFTAGQTESFVKLNTNLDEAANALRANLQEFLSPVEAGTTGQRQNLKLGQPLDPNGQTVQEPGLQASQDLGGTYGSMLGQTFQAQQKVATAREAARKSMNIQLRDTLDIKREYMRAFDAMTRPQGSLTKSFDETKAAADNMSTLCKRHLPRQGEECGQNSLSNNDQAGTDTTR